MGAEKSYDGKLIGIARGEINEWDTRLFYYGPEGRYPIHPQMLCKEPPSFAKEGMYRLPSDIRAVIVNGRLRVFWLINSRGGIAMTADRIQLGMEGVRQRNGTVESYGFDEFGSAAGRIWFDADRRHCTEASIGTWHMREGLHESENLHPDIKDFIQKKRLEDMQAIIGIINSVQDPELREALFQMAKEDPEQRLSIGLNGQGLKFSGIAREVTKTKRQLFDLFLDNSGWRPGSGGLPSLLLDPVGRFAIRTLSEESRVVR